ncbi:hypothetical protein TSUD_130340 [Trifolium subterraneum]|nr:hypothetical protein TSUD_130340 [Trifolium subterraneum]
MLPRRAAVMTVTMENLRVLLSHVLISDIVQQLLTVTREGHYYWFQQLLTEYKVVEENEGVNSA